MYQYIFITERDIYHIKHYYLRPLNLHMDQNDEIKATKITRAIRVQSCHRAPSPTRESYIRDGARFRQYVIHTHTKNEQKCTSIKLI